MNLQFIYVCLTWLKQDAIIRAIRNARKRTDMLVTGQAANLSDLAKKLGMAAPYVTSILGLSNLAPDIVESICSGSEPKGVSLARLVKGFPDDWEEQRMVMVTKKTYLSYFLLLSVWISGIVAKSFFTIPLFFKDANVALRILKGAFPWIEKSLSQYSTTCATQYCLIFLQRLPNLMNMHQFIHA